MRTYCYENITLSYSTVKRKQYKMYNIVSSYNSKIVPLKLFYQVIK